MSVDTTTLKQKIGAKVGTMLTEAAEAADEKQSKSPAQIAREATKRTVDKNTQENHEAAAQAHHQAATTSKSRADYHLSAAQAHRQSAATFHMNDRAMHEAAATAHLRAHRAGDGDLGEWSRHVKLAIHHANWQK